jgi:hypothetical protein
MRGRIEKRVGKTGVSYRIRWEMGSDVQGRRTQPSKTFKTRKEAESALAEALKEAHQGTAIVEDKRTLGVYLADWLETLEKRVRPSTARRYRELLSDHVIPQLGRVQLVKLTPLHLERLYTTLLTCDLTRGLDNQAPGGGLSFEAAGSRAGAAITAGTFWRVRATRDSAGACQNPPRRHCPAVWYG